MRSYQHLWTKIRLALIILIVVFAIDKVLSLLKHYSWEKAIALILAIFGSALGVGIGLGFQDIAKNFGSGVVLLFERSVQIGDFIEVNGHKETVERIQADEAGAQASQLNLNNLMEQWRIKAVAEVIFSQGESLVLFFN